MKKTTQAGENGASSDQLDMALRDIEDILGRALCPFVLLGQTARDIVDGKQLTGNKITVGVESKHLTKEAVGTLKVYLKKDMPTTLKSFDYEPSGVPKYKIMPRVYVKVIKKRWKFLKNKDYKFHLNTEYLVPNPFKNYWKAKGLVR